MQKGNHETGSRQYKGKRMRALGYALVAVIIVAVLVKYILERV